MTQSKNILTINGGSSSIRFALFTDDVVQKQIFSGAIERIGLAAPIFWVKGTEPQDNFSRVLPDVDFDAAIQTLVDWVQKRLGMIRLLGIGHRVVHGGPNYSAPALVTDSLLQKLRQWIPADPEHLPRELQLIDAFRERFFGIEQVVCFDTAFHHDLPWVAKTLAIPRRYQTQGIRRYGFHGLSYTYLLDSLGRLDPGAAQGKVVFAHLGNGASLAAVHHGKPVDTSMGFTPAAGLPMGTRCGDLDPGLALFLNKTEGLDTAAFDKLVTAQSGLLGLSETSSDMQTLLANESQDARAAEAVALFCYQVKKWIGAFAAVLGGLDTLVFSGGIGENAAQVRERACEGLGFLGIEVDPIQNVKNEGLISKQGGRVKVRVIKTNEDMIIAKFVSQLLGTGPLMKERP